MRSGAKANKTSQSSRKLPRDGIIDPMNARELLRRPGFLPLTITYGLSEIGDWLTCSIPGGFVTGLAPHTVAAYRSPANGHSMALVANWSGDPVHTVAVIDLTRMLDKDIVPRTKGKGLGHACASGSLSTTGRDAVVRFITVP